MYRYVYSKILKWFTLNIFRWDFRGCEFRLPLPDSGMSTCMLHIFTFICNGIAVQIGPHPSFAALIPFFTSPRFLFVFFDKLVESKRKSLIEKLYFSTFRRLWWHFMMHKYLIKKSKNKRISYNYNEVCKSGCSVFGN